MIEVIKLNDNPCFTLGDVHGKIGELSMKLERYQMSNLNIIQVGDWGMGIMPNQHSRLEKLNQYCLVNNIIFYIIRGNHDNPAYFDGCFSEKYSNLKFIMDYTVLYYKYFHILCIGGATSIDRKSPKNKDYFPNETFKLDNSKLNNIIESFNIRHVVTHSAPSIFMPLHTSNPPEFILNFAKNDDKLLEDLTDERLEITKLYNVLSKHFKLKSWVYGHFHRSYLGLYESVNTVLLSELELKKLL